MRAAPRIDYRTLDDMELAARIASRDFGAVRLVTERNNQRLFRVAWSILKNRSEAEDAVQSAYLRAFAGIGDFRGGSSLTTWLTRIVINEALGRQRAARRRRRHLDATSVVVLDEYRDKLMRGSSSAMLPDGALARQQIKLMLEQAIAQLPESFRLVFILRQIEGLSVDEVAESLGIPPATVKTRDLRARRRLQEQLAPELKATLSGVFPFAGVDCEAMTERVIERLSSTSPDS